MDILYFFHLFKRAEGIMPKIYRHEEGDKPVSSGQASLTSEKIPAITNSSVDTMIHTMGIMYIDSR